MLQLFICPQGHRWELDLELESGSNETRRCPTCGAVTETAGFQELGQAAHPLGKAAMDVTAFQQLKHQVEGVTRPLAKGGTEATAFQELGAQQLMPGSLFQDLGKQARPPGFPGL